MKHNGRLKVKFDFSFFAVVAFMIFIDTSGAAVLSLIACILHEGGHLLAMAVCGANPERISSTEEESPCQSREWRASRTLNGLLYCLQGAV